MIEKLKEHDIIDPKTDKIIGKIGCDLREIMDKLNELVDAVNTIQKEREAERFEIQEWIGILEAVRKSVNVHKKQIDKLQLAKDVMFNRIDMLNNAICDIRNATNTQDEFAEERKWIGTLCKFWDNDDTQQLSYGVLTKIDTESGFGVQYCCNDEYDYDACKPVKPDDDIIYKGEQ